MVIAQGDLKYFKSEEVSELPTNGGLMSMLTTDEAVTGIKNNIWPNVSAQQRLDGVTHYRKLFANPASDTDDELVDPRVWNHGPTPGDDYVTLFGGTKTDTQATLSEARIFGTGDLKTNISVGATQCTVVCENAAQTAGFVALDKVRLSDQNSPEASGNYEDIDLNSTPVVVSSNEVTIYFDGVTVNAYTAANTVVSSLYQVSSTSASVGTIVVSSVSGTVDESGFPPEMNNAGTVDESLTVEFTSTTEFTVTGTRSGSLGTGDVNSDFTALHPYNSKQLIKLFAGFFSSTGWLALDTVTIPTIANNIPFWLKKIVPAASGSLAGDYNVTAYRGESA